MSISNKGIQNTLVALLKNESKCCLNASNFIQVLR